MTVHEAARALALVWADVDVEVWSHIDDARVVAAILEVVKAVEEEGER